MTMAGLAACMNCCMTLFKTTGTCLALCLFIQLTAAQSLSNLALDGAIALIWPSLLATDTRVESSSSASIEVLLDDFVWGRDQTSVKINVIEAHGYDLSALDRLQTNHAEDPYFFDRYFHPEAQYLTGYHLGRAGMPIIQVERTATHMTLTMSCHTEKARIYYTLDGQIPDEESLEYSGPVTLPLESEIRVKSIRPDLEHSAVCLISQGQPSQLPPNEILNEDKIMGVFPIPDSNEAVVKYKTQRAGRISISIIDTHRQVHEKEDLQIEEAHFGHIRLNTADIPEGPYLVKFKFENGRTTYRQVTR